MQEWTVLVNLLDELEGTEAGADRLKLIFDASIMDRADLKSLRDEQNELEEEGKDLKNLSVHSFRVWHDLIHTMKNMFQAIALKNKKKEEEMWCEEPDLGRTAITTDL